MKRILFLSYWFPYPADNGSKLRIYNLLKQLSTAFEIDLLSFCGEAASPWQIEHLSQYCQTIQYLPYKSSHLGRLKSLAGFLCPQPRSLFAAYDPDFQELVNRAEKTGNYDALLISQIDMAPYAMRSRIPLRILEELEVSYTYDDFQSQPAGMARLRRALTWWKLCQYLRRISRVFHACTVVSELEQKLVKQVCPHFPVHLVPNGVDIHYNRPAHIPQKPDALVFSGSLTYHVNLNAAAYFLREIFPLIQQQRPAARLTITGRTDGLDRHWIKSHPAVHLTGFVEDVRPIIQSSRVNVVPILHGGGTRLKILESFALGVPVVSTSVGIKGLAVTPGREALVADSPDEFARAVLQILSDNQLSQSLVNHARVLVEQVYDWEKIGAAFRDLINQL